jgi:hypothetical protein
MGFMKLKYCSITGADDAVEVGALSALAAEFPFLETAILLLPARAGTARFPKLEWIENFSKTYRGNNAAMHLCDDGFLGFVAGRPDILELMRGFKRIQLNLKFGDVEGKYDPAELVARVRAHPQWQFILQYTHDKKGLLPAFQDVANHAVLFDESAGRGISPDSWDSPLPGHFCGYAGGMNPDNVEANIKMIQKVAAGHVTWIDMESGVRTDDRFDLAKMRKVLEITKPYIAPEFA